MSINIISKYRSFIVCYNVYQQILRFSARPVSKKIDQFVLLKEKTLLCNNKFNPEFINSIKKEIVQCGNRINLDNFDSLFLESCIQNGTYEVGKEYFYHLYERTNELSLALVRKYFRLCYFNRNRSDEEKQLIINLYNIIMTKYQFLDDITCECLSMGLSITKYWKEIIRLINMSKEYGKPTNQLYSSCIIAAFDNNEAALGWEYFEEMLQKEMKPNETVYSAILNKMDDSSILKLFNLMEKYSVHLPDEIASLLRVHRYAKVTNITPEGYCKSCNEKLQDIIINENEFKILTDEFLNPVLIGRDIFIKSKPSELEEFLHFLRKSPKVDIVIDGLNVAYSGSKKNFSPFNNSKMLLDVVMHFVKANKRVMVLGRSHMEKWTPKHIKIIKNNSYIFFTDDLSADDPYLLYATMYYGLGTKFVSRDLMRGHKFLLKTAEKKKIFAKWQQKHQLLLNYADENGEIKLKSISNYLMDPQCSGTRWHIPIHEPIQSGVHPHVQALKLKWLCFDFKRRFF